MKKVIAVLLALCLCMTAVAALAQSGETGENASTGKGSINAYDQPQYTELKEGEKLQGTAIGDKAEASVVAVLNTLTADAAVASYEVVGLSSEAATVMSTLTTAERGSMILYLFGFYSDVADADLPADIAAAKALADASGLTPDATVTSTMITYNGKEAELRTVSFKVVKTDGSEVYNHFNYIRYTGETEWTLVSANEALQ